VDRIETGWVSFAPLLYSQIYGSGALKRAAGGGNGDYVGLLRPIGRFAASTATESEDGTQREHSRQKEGTPLESAAYASDPKQREEDAKQERGTGSQQPMCMDCSARLRGLDGHGDGRRSG